MLLLHGDCIEKMMTLPDKSIDLFLCDLPYGCLSGRNIGKTAEDKKCWSGNPEGCEWDVKIDLEKFWEQVRRLMKDDHTPILHFCNTRFGHELISSNPDWFRYDLVWEKTNAVGFLCANKMPLRSHENIYVFAKKGAKYYRKDIEGDFAASGGGRSAGQQVYGYIPPFETNNEGRRCVKSVVTIPNKKGKGNHPTQKPADLYRWLIDRYSKEGDTCLDATAGSFTSVFTAEEMGRTGIGIEKNKEFYDKAVSRRPPPPSSQFSS